MDRVPILKMFSQRRETSPLRAVVRKQCLIIVEIKMEGWWFIVAQGFEGNLNHFVCMYVYLPPCVYVHISFLNYIISQKNIYCVCIHF